MAAAAARWAARTTRPAAVVQPSNGPLPLGPVGVSQLALIELAIGVTGHLVNEVEGAGGLEAGQLSCAESQDVVGQLLVSLDTGGGLDHRLHFFAPVLVGDAEHGRVRHLRM